MSINTQILDYTSAILIVTSAKRTSHSVPYWEVILKEAGNVSFYNT